MSQLTSDDDDDWREYVIQNSGRRAESLVRQSVSWAAWHARKGYFLFCASPTVLPCVCRGSLRSHGGRQQETVAKPSSLQRRHGARRTLRFRYASCTSSLAAWWIQQHYPVRRALCGTGVEVGVHWMSDNGLDVPARKCLAPFYGLMI